MVVSFQLVGAATVTPNLTVLVPWVARKFAPAIVTVSPMWPDAGATLVSAGAGITVNAPPLLTAPPTLTVTVPGPGVTPAGTAAVTLVSLHAVTLVAAVVLNSTLLPPCDAAKFVPVITTLQFAGPDVGFTAVMCGGTGLGTIVFESVVPSTSSSTFTLWLPGGVEIEYPTHSRRRSVVDCGTDAPSGQLKVTGIVGAVPSAGPIAEQSVMVLLTSSFA